jgi:HK97 family phage major capsid protein
MSDEISNLLDRYRDACALARKFHGELIGKNVNPENSFGDFLCRIARGDRAGLEKHYGSTVTKTALSASAGGVTGGYTVPEELRQDLLKDVAEESLFRPRALVVPMASATVRLPLPDATTAQAAGVPPFFGGISLRWLAEAQTRTESEPAFRLVELKANDLTGYALAANVLLADAGRPLDAFLRRLFARSLAWFEDYAFLVGDGVGKPLGVTKTPAAVSVTRQEGAAFTLGDVAALSGALLPASWGRACWAVSPTAWKALGQPAGAGGFQFQANENYAGLPGRPHFVLDGRPGYVTEKLPACGTAGDVVLFDPALYVIGDRGAVEVAFSQDEPTAFLRNQAVWRVTSRVDGRPWLDSPVTLPDTTSTVSPYVYLN